MRNSIGTSTNDVVNLCDVPTRFNHRGKLKRDRQNLIENAIVISDAPGVTRLSKPAGIKVHVHHFYPQDRLGLLEHLREVFEEDAMVISGKIRIIKLQHLSIFASIHRKPDLFCGCFTPI